MGTGGILAEEQGMIRFTTTQEIRAYLEVEIIDMNERISKFGAVIKEAKSFEDIEDEIGKLEAYTFCRNRFALLLSMIGKD